MKSPLLIRAMINEVIEAVNDHSTTVRAEEGRGWEIVLNLNDAPYTQLTLKVEVDD
jgi:hypothetical protein